MTEVRLEEQAASPARGLSGLLRWLTVEQWWAIDAEYRQADTRLDLKGAGALLLVAVGLTLQKYFGGRGTFTDLFGSYVSSSPYRALYPHLYWVFGCSVVYFVLPALFIRFVLNERIRDYGFRVEGVLRHAPLYFLMFMVVFPFVLIASGTPSFLEKYPFYANAGRSWTELLVWEGAYGLQFVMLEFFFRGFMLFALARYLGAYAIFVMVVPYNMIHFSKPLAETVGSIIAGTALGTLALRTRSIFGGIAIHVAIAWLMDFLALWREGQLQRLFH